MSGRADRKEVVFSVSSGKFSPEPVNVEGSHEEEEVKKALCDSADLVVVRAGVITFSV